MLRTFLCVGLLGSAATIFIGQNTAISMVAIGVFGACLTVAGIRSLGRASRRVDKILAEELASANDNATPRADRETFLDSWRKTA